MNPFLREKTEIRMLQWDLWSSEATIVAVNKVEVDVSWTHWLLTYKTIALLFVISAPFLSTQSTVEAPHLTNWKCFKKTTCQRTSQGKCQPFFPQIVKKKKKHTWKLISSSSWKHTAKKQTSKALKPFIMRIWGQKSQYINMNNVVSRKAFFVCLNTKPWAFWEAERGDSTAPGH